MVSCKEKELVITIPTASPNETRIALIQSIINNFKMQSMSELPIQPVDKEHNYWSLNLLENLIEDQE